MDTKISVNEATLKLNISPQSIKRWLTQGKLNGEKFNGKWYVINDSTFEYHLDTNGNHVSTNNSEQILRDEVRNLREIIAGHKNQIQELHQIIAMQQKSIQQLTGQNQLLLEDKRKPSFLRWLRVRFSNG